MELLDEVRQQIEVGNSFTARDLKTTTADNLHSVQNALWALSKDGYLDKPRGKGSKGIYVLRGRRASTPLNGDSVKKKMAKRRSPSPSDADPDMVVIEQLLNAMAAAEPVIKKWSKVHEALKGI